ncbi:urease accessory protein UreE [Pseudomonas alliivorans]|uniref:Urease accessory protein UreE n=1 Tax=Pseudomonas alliivorans TaxID=2810613 RepID=A0ABS4CD47_9PSED|nr:urease accessory protein UreE [Pseudomonas alliivorans]MBP0948272.1 urease accessory protein UreE [Pseudomonas alliivorans]MEE4325074.1 urease accessory protein UreE [Pseudomonas alliivorans]MEE4332889.1 urease accessory protein UreE [Pseudomonas alliivorans]MEE4366604.1 urease accessory protein UreE [Pseudomonas alliivorans]
MLILDRILGQASDPALAERLHDLSHNGQVETLCLSGSDIQRHRLRLASDQGTDCAIRLQRHQQLRNGSVLMLDGQRAIVVQMQDQQYLSLRPRDTAAALELGYFAGNMHWAVRFAGDTLQIPLNGPEADYLERLAPMIADGRVSRA